MKTTRFLLYIAVAALAMSSCDKIDADENGNFITFSGVSGKWENCAALADHTHRVMLEKYTGCHCPNCPRADVTINTEMAQPLVNLFNDFYARDTSKKIRAVMKAKGNSGEHLCTNPLYGYVKDPADKKKWIVDEEAAEVVKRIFNLCIAAKAQCRLQRS